MTFDQTITANANGSPEKRALGAYTYVIIRSASAAAQVSFDGQAWQTANQNDSYGPLSPQPANIYFRSTAGVATTVTFSFGDSKMSQQPAAQSNASTGAVGNLGIANGTAAANGNPQCDANSLLYITNNMALAVPGVNAAGNRRQIIIFSVPNNSPAPLQVMDANGFGFMTIPAGTVIPLVTDSAFILSGSGGTAYCTIGQMLLAQQC
jgi:hypothetical protein